MAEQTAVLGDLRMLEEQREELVREKHELEEAKRDLETRNAALLAEMAAVRAEVQRAHERADAMEAASALLQNAEDEGARLRTESIVSDEHEERKGSRSINGSVALVNVPAMHGGTLVLEHGEEDDPELMAGMQSGSIEVVGRMRGASSGRGSSLFGRPTKSHAGVVAGGGHQDTGGALGSNQELGAVRGSVTRKFSFTRKAGQKIVRSLSFGSAEPKREWDERR